MKSKIKKIASAEVYQECSSTVGELREDDRLAKFFEILLQNDQRQKRDGKDTETQIIPTPYLIRLAIQVPVAPTGTPQQLPLVTLSEQEQEEFKRYRFKSQLPVHITGQTEGRKSNVITIGGHEVILPDAEFKLFLRLAVALYQSVDGFVDRGQMKQGGGLANEGIYFAEMLDQAASRLRCRLGPALEGLKATKYIEVQRKRIRLSTHRACVSVDQEALLKHPNDQIRSLAAHLPNNAAR